MEPIDVTVDADLCEGHGLCNALAPHVFELDEATYVSLVIGEVRRGEDSDVLRAVRACPEGAIRTSGYDDVARGG